MSKVKLPELKLLDAAAEVELARRAIDFHWLRHRDKLSDFQVDVINSKVDRLVAVEKELRELSTMFWGQQP